MKGIDLWKKAKKIIPGGTQLFSKRSELFLPEKWPSYYQDAKGIKVRDLDGTWYRDFSIMGVGACILGYADDDVNTAVKKAIDQGSMTTLNAPEDVELAETLLEIDPWAGMVRYARAGGEAMAIAARIARSHTKKDIVAFCGYHGWHDWYLSANIADAENLNAHLMAGLDSAGVPKALKGTAKPFLYNKSDMLKEIAETNELGAIVLEPIRYEEPDPAFLRDVQHIAKKTGAILILDEITSGWRMNLGGTFKRYDIKPDIVVYGKGMSNGYPMAAIVGKSDIMDAAQRSFISSTYWTERIGPTAALATIRKMQDHNVPEHLIKTGTQISTIWKKRAKEHNLAIHVHGIPPLTTFAFEHEQSKAMHTLFTQEMLKRGYLASKSVYVSFSHTERDIEDYDRDVAAVFALISNALADGNLMTKLDGPVAQSGFKRLN